MENKYVKNYLPAMTVLTIMVALSCVFAIETWKHNTGIGIVLAVCLTGIAIGAFADLFGSKTVRSVTVTSSEIIIAYKKTTVHISYDDCTKIELVKHGPFKNIIVYAENGYYYKIDFDLKNFRGMCKDIYIALSAKHKEDIANESFCKRYAAPS